VQRIEIGDAVNAQDHRFAVEDEPFLPDLPRRFNDPGMSARPVIAVAGEQAHAIAVPLYTEAVSIFTAASRGRSGLPAGKTQR
jgi:hypothetical protein